MKSIKHFINAGTAISLAFGFGLINQSLFSLAQAQCPIKQPAAACPTQCPTACPTPCPTQGAVIPPGGINPNLTEAGGYSLAAQGITPAIKGRVINMQVISNPTNSFRERVRADVVHRAAPVPGMTRAAVESTWGPSLTSVLRPGKPVSIYVNNRELVDGYLMDRRIMDKNLKVYEVVYCDSDSENPSLEGTVVSVKPIFMPAVGDHKNMYSLFLHNQHNAPLYGFVNHDPNREYYIIPEARVKTYRPLIQNANQLVRVTTDSQGIVVAQEFVSGEFPIGYYDYGFSSAGSYSGI